MIRELCKITNRFINRIDLLSKIGSLAKAKKKEKKQKSP
jgi:hypothetical protein